VNREVLSFLEEQFEARRRKDYVGEASGLATSRPTGNYSNLTLQLTPEDAEKLLFLMNKYSDNRIFFALRNAADQAIVEKLEGTLLDDVLGPESDYGLSKRKLPEPPPPRPPRIIDRRGGVAVPIE
jgi:hypothetical protein